MTHAQFLSEFKRARWSAQGPAGICPILDPARTEIRGDETVSGNSHITVNSLAILKSGFCVQKRLFRGLFRFLKINIQFIKVMHKRKNPSSSLGS